MRIKVAFLGAGSHSDAVKPHLDNIQYEFIGYFDDKDIKEYRGFPILGKMKDAIAFLENKKIDKVFITIGDNRKRKELFDYINERHPDSFINIISKNSTILTPESIKGKGIFISQCFIGSYAEVYDNSIVNTGSVVEHHSIVGKHCNVTPSSTLNFCKLGEGVYVGSGSTIIQMVEIAPYVILGAGSVVVKSIEEQGTYVGVPAKKIK